ncbi:hypothetical protein TELCIR_24505 [Teladorsagia circumcincta]|uniref:Uncharacterized protein n=1 Tax=Teladorsagia circumcincta TaxID=45464 RepID=A0A2G9T8C6_TELCI|nr:hypothetical protein TELCIR_24505 [Teladorsagia circumcincta]
MTMMAFRKIYREIDEKDKSASHFIDVLLLTARQARELEISRKLESEKLVMFGRASLLPHFLQ